MPISIPDDTSYLEEYLYKKERIALKVLLMRKDILENKVKFFAWIRKLEKPISSTNIHILQRVHSFYTFVKLRNLPVKYRGNVELRMVRKLVDLGIAKTFTEAIRLLQQKYTYLPTLKEEQLPDLHPTEEQIDKMIKDKWGI